MDKQSVDINNVGSARRRGWYENIQYISLKRFYQNDMNMQNNF